MSKGLIQRLSDRLQAAQYTIYSPEALDAKIQKAQDKLLETKERSQNDPSNTRLKAYLKYLAAGIKNLRENKIIARRYVALSAKLEKEKDPVKRKELRAEMRHTKLISKKLHDNFIGVTEQFVKEYRTARAADRKKAVQHRDRGEENSIQYDQNDED